MSDTPVIPEQIAKNLIERHCRLAERMQGEWDDAEQDIAQAIRVERAAREQAEAEVQRLHQENERYKRVLIKAETYLPEAIEWLDCLGARTLDVDNVRDLLDSIRELGLPKWDEEYIRPEEKGQ